ncbi:hypothetical protein H9Y04_40815 [Streptomyces sp. TRM66268-LWL]|uniref:PH domain-containing protein n=1 Tax=Streptomyces polyasparticus TaxID=2767826 RepID=A0ABR7STU0_9ACTN|nr:hypothetical protein [Streptomyces polyasparticus]MBC9718890.1 hypothetical protein [Streptomyces polyasparticus]
MASVTTATVKSAPWPKTIRRVSLCIFAALAVLATYVGVVFLGFVAARRGDPVGETVQGGAVLTGSTWLYIRLGRSRVEISERGLTIVDWWSREWIPWGAYVSVHEDSQGGLTITTRGEVEHKPAAFGGSLIETLLSMRGRGLIIRAARAIKTARGAVRPEHLDDRTVVKQRWEFIWADMLPVVALLTIGAVALFSS